MKTFNTTGHCVHGKHYMADTGKKINEILQLIISGKYFVINRPRQYGKTTSLYLVRNILREKQDYYPIFISFEGIGADAYLNEKKFFDSFTDQILDVFERSHRQDIVRFIENSPEIVSFSKLGRWMTRLIQKINKKVILIIDEVDRSSNNQLFMDFLSLLRKKYLAALSDEDQTFYSVVLSGVHDVKSLKIKINNDANLHSHNNSPWNIAVDFLLDLSLTSEEIANMLADYASEQNLNIDTQAIGERLYYFTSGYPFLVSKICQMTDTLRNEKKINWTVESVNIAVSRILKLNNTNFESLIKNLQNNNDLYNLIFEMLIDDAHVHFNEDNPIIHYGLLYGIFKEKNGQLEIHNRIYKERIYNYMASIVETQLIANKSVISDKFLWKDGRLNMEKLLLKFQEFMKSEYSKRDQ